MEYSAVQQRVIALGLEANKTLLATLVDNTDPEDRCHALALFLDAVSLNFTHGEILVACMKLVTASLPDIDHPEQIKVIDYIKRKLEKCLR